MQIQAEEDERILEVMDRMPFPGERRTFIGRWAAGQFSGPYKIRDKETPEEAAAKMRMELVAHGHVDEMSGMVEDLEEVASVMES